MTSDWVYPCMECGLDPNDCRCIPLGGNYDMTSDRKPSEGAMRAAAVVGDICDGFWDEDSFEEAGRAIDREAVTPAVKPLVEALDAMYALRHYHRGPKRAAAFEQARAALEPWRHLLDESGE